MTLKKPITCISCNRKSKIFHFLTEEELKYFNESRLEVSYNAGETIRKQGTASTHLLSVNTGYAKVYIEGANKKNLLFRIVQPTNFIGAPGTYADNINHYSVSALTDCSVCIIDANVFKEIIRKNSAFAEAFIEDISSNFINVISRMVNLTQKNMEGRLADALIYLSETIVNNPHINLPLTTQDYADLSGMSRDSAVKILRGFSKDDIIEVKDNTGVMVYDLDELKRISAF